ncbi:MAG: polysaccharide pyruvyl transferase family protein [Muribaculaceae bacterium]|nr:polysaccharide pyruvyl transferase family protein [Muribaculaceae bacterium]
MKIVTVTCSNAENYGARLQAAALAARLCHEGHDVHVLDYRPWYMRFYPRPALRHISWRNLPRELWRWRYNTHAQRRHELFDDFSRRYIPLTPEIRNLKDLRENPPVADVFIAGSDQIWNPQFRNGSDPTFFLEFGDRSTRRISYAASFGVDSVDVSLLGSLREHLSGFHKISVRESAARRIVGLDLGLPTPDLVLDPVFLQPRDYWENIADEGSMTVPASPYILVYDFMRSKDVKRVAKRIAKAGSYKIVSVGPHRMSYASENRREASPAEFLALIRGASCIVSNSFHGTAFAMIFNRDFFVVMREDGLNDRMTDFLGRMNLNDRIVDARTPVHQLLDRVDYEVLAPIIDMATAESANYLFKAIEG